MKRTKSQQKALAALLGALTGVLVFLWVYGAAPLHTGWDGWILNGYDETDVQQHYAGWLLFRNSHWAFPLGLADTLAAPDGTVISYTDSIPWASIFFKLLRGVLPATFQWFGWYVLACFALQGAAGALLALRRGGLPFAVLGGALFACLPTLWERAFRHTALASHWLYLFALYAYLEYRAGLVCGRRRYPWALPLLAFAAVGIHPYFLPPVMVCALLASLDCARLARRPAQAAAVLAGPLAAALAGGVLCGALGSGVSASREGYGVFSMNLNAPFNPSSRGGYTWSRLLPVLGQQPAQYDGFNYLGLGVLVLAAAALVWAALHPNGAAAWRRRNGPLLAACAFLTLFAVSNGVYWGDKGITLPLPGWLVSLCGIFRSSGRMFYLVGACILLFGLYTLADAFRRPGAACLALAAVLALQAWDLGAVAAEKRALFAAQTNATAVNAEQTQTLGVGHTALAAAGELRQDRLRLLAVLAGKQGLATNLSIAVSGEYPAAAEAARQAAALLQSGRYDPQTVYVTTDGGQYEAWQAVFADDPAVALFVVDSCYFLVPTGG